MHSDSAGPLSPELPGRAGQRLRWYGLRGAASSLAVARGSDLYPGLTVIVTDSSQSAQRTAEELRFFAPDAPQPQVLPDWETLPYDVFSPHQDIVSERLATLHQLPQQRGGTLIVPVTALLQRLAPPSHMLGGTFMMRAGERLDMEAMRSRLEQAGYRCVSEVMEHGEFAVRGALFDLFPMGSGVPFRIDLFDDEIETIRTFDPETQRTVDKVETIELLPAREFPSDEAAVKRFRQAFRARFEGDPQSSVIYREVSAGHFPGGIEYYLPLFFDETATLFDYLPDDALFIRLADFDTALEHEWRQIHQRFEQRGHDIERPLLSPTELYLAPDELRAALNAHRQVLVCDEDAAAAPDSADVRRFETRALPDLRFNAKSAEPAGALRTFIEGFEGRILLLAETAGRREALMERLGGARVRPKPVEGWADFLATERRLALAVSGMEQGVILPDAGIALIPEAELLGERAQQRRRRQAQERDPEAVIRDLGELSVGAPVVHEDHGVGRYIGLQSLDVGGIATEFLTLEYAGGDKLYVPVASLHLISQYTGADPEHAPLHRLGSDQWEKAKRKAAAKARDAAAELLDIYARRAAQAGHAYRFDEAEYQGFAEAFPFEETADQDSAIQAVVRDLRAEQPMDRVVCGDVGFGKTEVAMRAAFIGLQEGRQVAVLVPTTLLAQQHYQNFLDRFADWPVRIEMLSRFRSDKEQKAVMADVAAGKVDIVIGTHKLLQPSVKFHDLGLVIIDEEQRFGVQQKERLKRLRANVDVLTLTATPIPRTLNMALAGLRDLSIIATPPARRLAVKTFVNQWNDGLIQEAILRELHRGGQVYFLHNDVDSIARIARQVEELVPEARVRHAHGQMRERDLERVMLDFYHQRFNVLVCTTIIESGIDVPTANTIVINRADRFGLGQLHQLRGRVGRSHHRAYAYLIAPPQKQMTADAKKRLEAIESLEDLGIGFALASHDLEIRGAGELLGEDQSGQINEIGFSLYSELLERAVRDLRSGREPDFDRPLHHGTEVDLRIAALLPEDYIPDVHTRLVLYKRIANARSHEGLRELQVEMIDRFGLLPEPAKNLFRLTELKLRAEALGIERLEAGPGGGVLEFGDDPAVDPGQIVQLIQEHPNAYRLEGANRLRFKQALEAEEARVSAVTYLLDRLGERAAA
ncbi:transcription-repair coupling factor [Ectothiorhodospiraceae bacterium WFHF3C12]|nr:transcription-repair coupling factor [Ectothiorhodospiraceae bacterium WFHF3C12]